MSRQINKERTRRRLLQAILKTIQRHGLGTLTTGRVAQLAGVAQPTFYVHFRSMDQALEQVAEWVAQELDSGLSPEAAAELDRAAEVLEEAVRKCTGSLVQDRKVAEVFLSNRRDQTSPLGRRWSVLTGSLRERMRQIVVQVRPDAAPADAALHAELLVSMIFGLAEAQLDGRVDGLDRATSTASRAIVTSILSTSSVADAA
ncbi:MAG: TetR/AcrR family transcriptional regulator [Deltaproteobacteria bacterium]|nr:TetR/AcrR family transcriptional regulator [Deltaproteobacteria bacterium]NND30407.1 TetR/AcrR family transcriptional regulator [Myxococcales bacterium]MBT8464995.1 TetR/AcrR family transcriptional regulator [Deltaproteobacteria bacterium]MBT8480810.1 TetR/AcrR family transcriptional regulator [Deltaproteobacteria bacterium]NNK09636.1 TetR/AcrR family transcriptional regulator [Myxococcales bacterium]